MMSARGELMELWRPVRQVLLALRDVVRAEASGSQKAAHRALEHLVREAAAPFGSDDGSAVQQGKSLAARLLQRLEPLAAEVESPPAPDRYLDASTRAIVGWFLLVTEGLRPGELYPRRPQMFGAKRQRSPTLPAVGGF